MDVEKLSVDGFNLNVADAKARNMISDKYDPDNGTYVVGDTCINDDILYICNTDIDTPETFDPSKWDADTIGHYCSELKSNLKQLLKKENSYVVYYDPITELVYIDAFYNWDNSMSAWSWLASFTEIDIKYMPTATIFGYDLVGTSSNYKLNFRMNYNSSGTYYLTNTAQIPAGAYTLHACWKPRGVI